MSETILGFFKEKQRQKLLKPKYKTKAQKETLKRLKIEDREETRTKIPQFQRKKISIQKYVKRIDKLHDSLQIKRKNLNHFESGSNLETQVQRWLKNSRSRKIKHKKLSTEYINKFKEIKQVFRDSRWEHLNKKDIMVALGWFEQINLDLDGDIEEDLPKVEEKMEGYENSDFSQEEMDDLGLENLPDNLLQKRGYDLPGNF